MHLMLEFGSPKNDIVREGTTDFVVGTYSYLKITKSKLGPKFSNIPCYVDVRKGGVIDEVRSFYFYIKDSGWINQGGGWMKLDSSLDYLIEKFGDKLNIEQLNSLRGNKREKDLIELIREDCDLLDLLQILLIEKICDVYPAHSLTTNDYRQKLIDRCNYFIDKNVSKRNVSDDELVDFDTITEGEENKDSSEIESLE